MVCMVHFSLILHTSQVVVKQKTKTYVHILSHKIVAINQFASGNLAVTLSFLLGSLPVPFGLTHLRSLWVAFGVCLGSLWGHFAATLGFR